MSYTPTNWQTGDTITAEKLNNMESGIANADSPLNTDKLHIVPISIDAQTGAVSSSHRFDYDSELALYQGTETLALEYENNRIFARLVSSGTYFLFEAELADYTKVAAKKLYIGIPLVGGPDAPSVAPFFVWADEPFIVTLTPTTQDFSGTMDKTVAEINAAYEAGRTIVFKIYTDQNGGYIVSKNVLAMWGAGATKFGFMSDALIDGIGLVVVSTGINPPSDRTTYLTAIYPLTPMS